MHDPCMRHWRGLQHLLRYLATFPKEGVHFEREEKSQGYQMKGYSDADFVGDVETRRSCAGYVLFVGETPISWSSKTESQTCDLLSYVYPHISNVALGRFLVNISAGCSSERMYLMFIIPFSTNSLT